MTVSSGVIVLAHFANFKLTGDRIVRDTVQSLQSSQIRDSASSSTRSFFVSSNPLSQTNSRRRRRRRGRQTGRSSARVNSLTDADLEAELAARRSSRARERERYAKAMRSEKLSLLEGELLRLRSEISRIDPVVPLGGGTPPTSRWEALAPPRGITSTGSLPQQMSTPGTPAPGRAPPPPPPPPPRGMDDDEPIDPEKQKREKAERQRRSEQKRKEREAAKKPLTLAEIIRGAGPDAAKRLKPSGSIKVPDILAPNEEEKTESVKDLKSQLKKASPVSSEEKDTKKEEDKEERESKPENSSSSSKTGEVEEKIDTAEDGENINSSGTSDKAAKENEKSESTDTKSSSKDENKTLKSGDAQDSQENESSDMKPNGSSAKTSNDDTNKETKPKELSSDSSLPANGPNIVHTDPNEGKSDKISGEAVKGMKLNDTDVKSSTDAMAAVSNLMANLPVKKATSASTTGRKSKKLSLAEKRALRRASGVPAATSDDSRSRSTDNKLDPADAETAGSDIKLD